MNRDTVRVWLVDARVPAPTLDALATVLDDEESARAKAYRHEDDRRRFTVAHAAARYVLGDLLRVPAAAIRWRRGPHGKPELAHPTPAVPVNLSHSGELTLVCVGTARPVGVDVQRLDPDRDMLALARRFFPAPEVSYVDTSVERFTTLWARKEAVVKAGGGRLAQGLRLAVLESVVHVGEHPGGIPPGPYRLAEVPVPDGYRAAVACYGAEDYDVVVAEWSSTVAVHR